MNKTGKIKVVQSKKEEPLPAEIIAESILDIAASMKKLDSTRLTRKALITLIHDSSKVPKKTIEIVLNNLEQLEATWLKVQPK